MPEVQEAVGPQEGLPEDRVRAMIQQAEAAKARMFANTGNENDMINYANPINVIAPTAIVDEGYIVVGAHLDEVMINKI